LKTATLGGRIGSNKVLFVFLQIEKETAMKKDIIILGIESSCDDTSAAVVRKETMLSNVIAGQAVHNAYGGVVPELASRAHQQNIVPVVSEAIKRADIRKEEIDAIAFTRGPGLLGSLLVGTSFAKGLSLSLGIPMLEVNHLHAHVLANFLREPGEESQHSCACWFQGATLRLFWFAPLTIWR